MMMRGLDTRMRFAGVVCVSFNLGERRTGWIISSSSSSDASSTSNVGVCCFSPSELGRPPSEVCAPPSERCLFVGNMPGVLFLVVRLWVLAAFLISFGLVGS